MTEFMTDFYSLIPSTRFQLSTWKNGQGITREIVSVSDTQGARLRLSQATITGNGQFSDFSGMHRTLIMLTGDGMTLRYKKAKGLMFTNPTLLPLDIAHFSGSDTTSVRLSNSDVEVLNIMTRESDTCAYVSSYRFAGELHCPVTTPALFYGFFSASDAIIRLPGQEQLSLPALTLLSIDPAQITHTKAMSLLSGSGILICITPTH